MVEDWDDEDAGSSFDCPSCSDGALTEGLMTDLNERGRPFFYHSLMCNKCNFNALTAVQYQAKMKAKYEGSR